MTSTVNGAGVYRMKRVPSTKLALSFSDREYQLSASIVSYLSSLTVDVGSFMSWEGRVLSRIPKYLGLEFDFCAIGHSGYTTLLIALTTPSTSFSTWPAFGTQPILCSSWGMKLGLQDFFKANASEQFRSSDLPLYFFLFWS